GLQRRLNILFEEGSLGDLIDTFYADRGLDLLVMGSKGRSAAAHALLGSPTDRLLSTAHCDVLVVPNNPPRAAHLATRPAAVGIIPPSVFTEIAFLSAIASIVGFIGSLLRQPLIVSFIAVGLLVGPAGLDIARSDEQIELLSQLGIAVLLFLVGTKLD